MTTEEYNTKLEERLNKASETKRVYDLAQTIHKQQVKRIFDEGKKAGGNIGQYSSTPLYAVKTEFKTGFQPKGKSGALLFKNGKPHKSMYLREGYKELKQVQGLESGFVNLTLSAQLKNDFANSLSITGDEVISGVSQPNTGKAEGLEKKYGDDLFTLSDDEKEAFKSAAAQCVTKYLTGTE
ncbi:MAG: hypothetical protein JWO06_2689 [Bacteroidota bacterium]|nr:hypothetical protein [Bacteroidota bacterium]